MSESVTPEDLEARAEQLYEVTVEQGHRCVYTITAPTPAEAERIARKLWDAGDYYSGLGLYHSLETWTHHAKHLGRSPS